MSSNKLCKGLNDYSIEWMCKALYNKSRYIHCFSKPFYHNKNPYQFLIVFIVLYATVIIKCFVNFFKSFIQMTIWQRNTFSSSILISRNLHNISLVYYFVGITISRRNFPFYYFLDYSWLRLNVWGRWTEILNLSAVVVDNDSWD